MTTDEKEWDGATRVLIRLTQDGELKWRIDNNLPKKREHIVGRAYVAPYESKMIAIYQYKYQYYKDEDDYDWLNDVAIEFVDDDGDCEWQWPKVESRWELLEAVRYKNSGAGSFLKTLLAKSKKQ